MRYEFAEDLQIRMNEIVNSLSEEMSHIDIERVKCFRSFGSSTRRTLARCHTIGKVMQKAMNAKAHYAIEFLEKFDRLSKEEQDKVIIHELMHIPKTFLAEDSDSMILSAIEMLKFYIEKFQEKKKEEDGSYFLEWRIVDKYIEKIKCVGTYIGKMLLPGVRGFS